MTVWNDEGAAVAAIRQAGAIFVCGPIRRRKPARATG
jgi:hypothetical protein